MTDANDFIAYKESQRITWAQFSKRMGVSSSYVFKAVQEHGNCRITPVLKTRFCELLQREEASKAKKASVKLTSKPEVIVHSSDSSDSLDLTDIYKEPYTSNEGFELIKNICASDLQWRAKRTLIQIVKDTKLGVQRE